MCIRDRLYEGLTGISFDGMYSSFIDNLMNMKYGAKDAACLLYTSFEVGRPYPVDEPGEDTDDVGNAHFLLHVAYGRRQFPEDVSLLG